MAVPSHKKRSGTLWSMVTGMSRTRPQIGQWEVAKRAYPSWRLNSGYPPPVRGAWQGRKGYAQMRQGTFRTQERMALALQDDQRLPHWRHGAVAWDVW